MALPELYEQITWHNGTTPAINEDNLNAMSQALKDIDDRVIEIASTIMEDVPVIQHDLEILEPAIENIDANVTRAETAADNAEADALVSEGYAVGTQDGVEVTSGEYYQNNAKYYAEIANPPIENTVDFADVITISDAINKAAKDVRLKVEAVQDLHGYNNPWVGGAGKNKLDFTVSSLKTLNTNGTWSGNVYTYGNVTFTVLVDNANNVTGIKVNGTSNGTVTFFLVKNADVSCPYNGYALNGCPSGGSTSTYYLRVSDNIIASNSDVGDGVTIALNDTGHWNCFIEMKNNVTISNLVYYPMIRNASESASYESPTNICPISGWDNAKVTRSGKNLLPYDLASLKAINTIGTWSGNAYTVAGATFTLNNDGTISVSKPSASTGPNTMYLKRNWYLPVGSYKINGTPSGGGNETRRITIEISNGSTLRYANDIGSGNEFTLASGEYISQLNIRLGASTTFTGTISPMLRDASISDATFEPYQGIETTISLNGTRYGGTLDVTSGVLTVTKAYETINGTKAVGIATSSATDSLGGKRINTSITNAKAVSTNVKADIISDKLPTVTAQELYALIVPDVIAVHDAGGVVLRYMGASTLADAQTALNNDPVNIVYELATPQTIQLTPTQVYLLYGYNTLYGDCGDVSLTYDASGIIHIEEAKLDTETLKTIAAASSDFADFKARIAAL